MGVERLDQLGEVGERSGQPIDLIDDDDVDPSGLHIDEQFRQTRPLHRAAGMAKRRAIAARSIGNLTTAKATWPATSVTIPAANPTRKAPMAPAPA